jgi:carotenoid phi-ring synthase / carotenoid chi-ring synthase
VIVAQTTKDNSDSFPVVIIGAGLAGLVAAAHLAEKGIPAIVLEASAKWAGGRLCGGEDDTFEHENHIWSFKPDHGVHAVWGNYVNLRATLERFTATELRPSQGEEWINRWGREVRVFEAGSTVRKGWLPAPFHYLQLLFRPRFWLTINPLDFLSLPGVLFSILWTVGFDPFAERIALDGLMLSDYFRGWTPNLRATFTGLAKNLLAAPADKISLTAFIAALRFYTMLRKDAWTVEYFPGNSDDTLIQPLIDTIEQHGGQIRYGAAAHKLEREEDRWRIVIEDDQIRGLRSLYANHVILALHAPGAQRLLTQSPDTASQALKLQFPTALRTTVVRLWFSRQPRTGASGGMCTGDFQIDNFFWLHQLYDEFADWKAQGGSAVEVHIYGTEKLLDQPEQNLLILAVNEIQHAFPELKGTFVHGVVRRNSRTHTQLRIPTRESLQLETPWLDIYACGDWIGYDTPSLWMERATTTGIAAANAVLADHGLEPYQLPKLKTPEFLVGALAALTRSIRRAFSPVIWLLRWLRHGRTEPG